MSDSPQKASLTSLILRQLTSPQQEVFLSNQMEDISNEVLSRFDSL